MPAATNKPQPYAQSPQPELKGSLQPWGQAISKNFELIEASIRQIIAYLYAVEATAAAALAAIKMLIAGIQAAITGIEDASLDIVYLTAEAGGSEWDLEDLDGYPNIRAVIIDPNSEVNTLNLPTLGADDRLCITVKCLVNSGNVTIDGGIADIVSTQAFGTVYSIPFSLLTPDVTITTYSATLIWAGSEWHIIDTAILAV